MITTMLAGRDAELAETASKWLAEHGDSAQVAAGRTEAGRAEAELEAAERDMAEQGEDG